MSPEGPVRWEARCRAGVSRTEDGCGEIEAPCRGAEAAGAALKSMHMIWVAFEIDVAVAFGSQLLLFCMLFVACLSLAGQPVCRLAQKLTVFVRETVLL